MFAIYAEDQDRKLVSTADDHTNGKEIHYKTYKEAETELNSIKDFFPKDYLKIVAIQCESCKGNDHLFIYKVNNEPKALCSNCIWELQSRVPLIKVDPKGELLTSDREELEKKGYHIMVANIEDQNGTFSCSPIGINRKVSLTLSEEEWDWLDEQANGNRSQFLRQMIMNAKSEKK